jgi:hypothetical protein
LADGALPKDIFFLVAGLSVSSNGPEIALYPPLRILVEVLEGLLGGAQQNSRSLPRLLRSRFGEASDWLCAFPHHILDLRKETYIEDKGNSPDPAIGLKKQETAYQLWATYQEISSHSRVSPWMPQFVFHSSIGDPSSSKDIYQKIMNKIDGQDWKLQIRLPSDPTPSGNTIFPGDVPLTWQGKELVVRFPMRKFGTIDIDFLNPKGRVGDDHRRWAKLLVTLGFFSYWCHLPDHRAVRTGKEIGEIIKKRTGKPYPSLGPQRESSEDLAEPVSARTGREISNEIELLEVVIMRLLQNDRHNVWWRYFIHSSDLDIIGKKKVSGDCYWLNASLVLDAN